MGAFTNTRVAPLGKDGKPVKVQIYTGDSNESSRSIAELEKVFKEQENKKTKK